MAFLDDIWCVSSPARTPVGFTAIQEELLTIGIRVHDGKTQLWNRSGQVPAGTEALTAAAQRSDREAIVWRGDISLPAEEQGLTVLGTLLGHPANVRSRLAAVSEQHDQLIEQILSVSDLQCAWILLLYCAAARPNYLLWVVHLGLTTRFAAHHDASLHRALSQLVSAPPTHMFWDVVSLPFSRGGLGLHSAVLTTNAAYWSSWADSLQMIQRRHPSVAGQILHELSHRNTAGFHVAAAGAAREELMRLGFEAPSWCDSRSETNSARCGGSTDRYALVWVATGSH